MRKAAVLLTLLLAGCGSEKKGDLVRGLDLKPESSRLDASIRLCDVTVLEENLVSPSKQYILSVHTFAEEGRDAPIILRLGNPQQKQLDAFVTEKSSKSRWAIGWHKDKDKIVLWTPNGTTVFNVSPEGIISMMECPQPEYGETGLSLMNSKYPQGRAEQSPTGDVLKAAP
jgi:hypothetical protein